MKDGTLNEGRKHDKKIIWSFIF